MPITALIIAALTAGPILPTPEDLGLGRSVDGPELADLDALVTTISIDGCERRLLGNNRYRFAEAEISCAAFASFALVARVLARGDDRATGPELEALARLLDISLSDRATGVFARGESVAQVGARRLPASVLYRGYLLLMLAGMERVGAADQDARGLFDSLAEGLRDDYGETPLLPSFGRVTWPCDNALAASGLTLHGRLRNEPASTRSGKRLATFLGELSRLPSGFPTRTNRQGGVILASPRGSVLAWTAAFLSMGGHPQAEHFADLLLEDFCDQRRLVGFEVAACREWPRGVSRRADQTSGPIIKGYGVGASALAIAATGATGRGRWHQRLLNLGYRVGLSGLTARPDRFPLENAILHWARSVQSW